MVCTCIYIVLYIRTYIFTCIVYICVCLLYIAQYMIYVQFFCISFFGSLYNLGYCLRRKMYKRLWRRLNAKDYSRDLCVYTYIYINQTYIMYIYIFMFAELPDRKELTSQQEKSRAKRVNKSLQESFLMLLLVQLLLVQLLLLLQFAYIDEFSLSRRSGCLTRRCERSVSIRLYVAGQQGHMDRWAVCE